MRGVEILRGCRKATQKSEGEAGSEAEGPRLNVVVNWFEELKERVTVP